MKNHKGLVVRRGQSFTIDLILSRQYDLKNDQIDVFFKFEKETETNSIENDAWYFETKLNGDMSKLKINVRVPLSYNF